MNDTLPLMPPSPLTKLPKSPPPPPPPGLAPELLPIEPLIEPPSGYVWANRTCENCGERFWVRPNQRTRARYCRKPECIHAHMLERAREAKKKRNSNGLSYLRSPIVQNSEVDYNNLHYVLKTLFATSGKYVTRRRSLRKMRTTDRIFEEYKIVTGEYPFIESPDAISTNTVIFCNVCPFASHCQKRVSKKMWVMCEIPSYDDFLIMVLNERVDEYKQLAIEAQYLINIFIRAWRHHVTDALADIDIESIIGNDNMPSNIVSFTERYMDFIKDTTNVNKTNANETNVDKK